MEQTLIREIKSRFPGVECLENEPMNQYTSFRVGGPAALLVQPAEPEEAAALLGFLRERGVRTFVMGNGTNLLFPDEGYDGAVLRTVKMAALRDLGEGRIAACGGALLSRTAVFARDLGLTGLEFAHGIPGSVGGAVVMNAGAYGGEMKDVVIETAYLDGAGNRRTARGAAHDFAYRHSRFGEGELVLETTLQLAPGREEEITGRMAELAAKRRASQPLDLPSAGSAFKRPQTGYAAALIDQAGLKGLRVGGAQVSEKHAGFIVNAGGATCADVLRLMDEVRSRVLAAHGVALEPEIRVVR